MTAGNATLALGIAGGGLNLFSTLAGANATRSADELQADAAATNALIAERAAASSIVSGQTQADNINTRGAQTLASQRAAQAANGVDVNSGTAANVQASTKYITEQNVNQTLANAANAAMGYTTQSQNYADRAGQLRAAADSNSSLVAGTSSLLTSATSVASNWYRMQRVGVQ
ncbi:hypothetical protein [Caballeronia sp. AZ10_KS36]|uniref:hypothetical protein n=1 Tax=Caballeronia sp. AZ10_KS36 TaxID=2921757 RepID=UPI002028141B|nr:hypothetical protein [Caballeronia sp. AZ10_KS36]